MRLLWWNVSGWLGGRVLCNRLHRHYCPFGESYTDYYCNRRRWHLGQCRHSYKLP